MALDAVSLSSPEPAQFKLNLLALTALDPKRLVDLTPPSRVGELP
jgi:hypothetical protein